jgi:formylmethanofuran dehydrogenase subunit E
MDKKLQHATVTKDGFVVPLIGISHNEVLEVCDLCGDQFPISDLTWTGQQMLCKKCGA